MYYPSRSRVSSEGRGTVEKVGFVGLGIMGAAMVRNLLGAGHKLVVHNRTRAKAELFAGHGAEVADSPREVAEKSDVVVTMLPGPPEVEGRADERTRTADLLITSDASGVAEVCRRLQMPLIWAGFFALPCPLLHRFALAVVSEWCHLVPRLLTRAVPPLPLTWSCETVLPRRSRLSASEKPNGDRRSGCVGG